MARPRRDAQRGELHGRLAAESPAGSSRPGAFVLHPYGRYCNANKFAGEVDPFEASTTSRSTTASTRSRSWCAGSRMGGAACWQFARPLPDAVGRRRARRRVRRDAGVPQGLPEREASKPTWYEQKLWHLYDATDYAREPLQPADGRLQRRDRQAEAGRRRDGPRDEEGRAGADAHHRPEDRRTATSRTRRRR